MRRFELRLISTEACLVMRSTPIACLISWRCPQGGASPALASAIARTSAARPSCNTGSP